MRKFALCSETVNIYLVAEVKLSYVNLLQFFLLDEHLSFWTTMID
jgi:hypothetical protein